MSEQNITSTQLNNVEHQADTDAAPLMDAGETTIPTRKTRSVDNENRVDRKRGTGGLDSLGGGRLP